MSAFSIQRRLLFLHIPKNAGTSIRSVLSQHVEGWQDFDTYDEKTRKKRDPAFANHFTLAMCQDLAERENIKIPWQDMFRVMVVRNPFERLLSLYNHRMRKLDAWYEGKPRNDEASKAVARKGFIPWLLETPHEGDKVLTRTPQKHWALDTKGEWDVDWVMRFEQLPDDWAVLRQVLEIDLPDLPRKNVGEGDAKDYRAAYNTEARKHVEKHFEKDLNHWGYYF